MPCKRCKPDRTASQEVDPLFEKIRHAFHLVEESASRGIKISLADLSNQVGLSKWHLQRVFTKLKGLSPHQLSNSVLSTMEEEQGWRTAKSETDRGTVTPVHEPAVGNSKMELPAGTRDFEACGWGWTESENAEVEDVLKELFPEIYRTWRNGPGIVNG